MSPPNVPMSLQRARNVIGMGRYSLGKGGRNPLAAVPMDENGEADCSALAAWANGLDRKQPEPIGWLSTSGLIRNAKERRLFEIVVNPMPGDLVVYGDWEFNGRKRQGHVGVVSATGRWGWWTELMVIHCSSTNSAKLGAAIAETNGRVFGETFGGARELATFIRRLP